MITAARLIAEVKAIHMPLTMQQADHGEVPQQWALGGVPDDSQHLRPPGW